MVKIINKKKILFVITSFATGGINRALQNYLNIVDPSQYDIDVFVLAHQGMYDNQFFNCILLPCVKALDLTFSRYDSKKGFAKLESAFTKILDRLTKGGYQRWLFKRVGAKLLRKTRYDAVIGYGEGAPKTFVSLMRHRNKIGWIHCDYASYYQINKGVSERDIFENLTSIVCVSEYTRRSFLTFFPDMEAKTFAIYNVLDDRMMRKRSLESIDDPFDDSFFNVVSVGRLDPVKRLSIIPQMARQALDAGVKLQWYIIGPKGGNQEEFNKLHANIVKYNVSETVMPLGEKSNPYPYIAHSDLLVNTSVSEACPYVINEAKILGTPVVCPDFGSAKEFIEYGVTGYYVPIENMSDTIVSLIKDKPLMSQMRENLASFKYDNNRILNQINALIR